jgi:hypothetical protein
LADADVGARPVQEGTGQSGIRRYGLTSLSGSAVLMLVIFLFQPMKGAVIAAQCWHWDRAGVAEDESSEEARSAGDAFRKGAECEPVSTGRNRSWRSHGSAHDILPLSQCG